MDKIVQKLNLTGEIQIVVFIILILLVFSTILFSVWGVFKKTDSLRMLKTRTKSWWIMTTLFLLATLINPIITYIGIAFLSFAALREFYSVIQLRKSDRFGMFVCYLAIPVQYYFAYMGWYSLFLIFIPVIMFIIVCGIKIAVTN